MKNSTASKTEGHLKFAVINFKLLVSLCIENVHIYIYIYTINF